MDQRVLDGRAAYEDQSWSASARHLAAADADMDLDVDDLDRLATALYLSGSDEAGFEVWARAHQRCATQGEVAAAARFAVRLAFGLGFKGDVARASGWVDRGRRLLRAAGTDCVEGGYLAHASAMVRIFEAGDLEGAHRLFLEAGRTGQRFADAELVTLARIGEGRMLIYLGEVAEGVALLDEAMVSVETREVSPLVVGDSYCTVIDACYELFDIARCAAWADSFSRWCEAQPDLVLYRGHCLLHRAEVMQIQGAWSDAQQAAHRACQRLAQPLNPLTLGGAHYMEGELHRLRGELAEAEAAYHRAHELGTNPQPGLALLSLAQGRVDAAAAAIRRVLAETSQPPQRARVLAAATEILLATSDVAGARAAAEELTHLAAVLGSAFLAARAEAATGAVLLAEGDPTAALGALRRGMGAWTELGAPYEGARTRVLMADACRALGDDDGADLELGAARAAFTALGAHIDLAGVTAEAAAPPDGLSRREAEVLRLLATGRTNKAIAGELFISERTVASHVSHIFTKLGLSTRAAATAYAFEHQMVDR